MNLLESMQKRHAVRDYNDEPLTAEQVNTLDEAIAAANAKQGLDLIALIGTDSPSNEAILDEKVGHAGQLLALTAVSLGLDTSWVVLHETADHDGAWTLAEGERMPAAIALGHGNRPGRPHRSKPAKELGAVETGDYANAPDWFKRGVEASMLAPSALGKQPFRFTLLADGRTVRAEALEGVQPEIGLGIAKMHFELAAGTDSFVWA